MRFGGWYSIGLKLFFVFSLVTLTGVGFMGKIYAVERLGIYIIHNPPVRGVGVGGGCLVYGRCERTPYTRTYPACHTWSGADALVGGWGLVGVGVGADEVTGIVV